MLSISMWPNPVVPISKTQNNTIAFAAGSQQERSAGRAFGPLFRDAGRVWIMIIPK